MTAPMEKDEALAVHTCSFDCERPPCMKAQRRELLDHIASLEAGIGRLADKWEQWAASYEASTGDPLQADVFDRARELRGLRRAGCGTDDAARRYIRDWCPDHVKAYTAALHPAAASDVQGREVVRGTVAGNATLGVRWDGSSDPNLTVMGWDFTGIATVGGIARALGGFLIEYGNKVDARPHQTLITTRHPQGTRNAAEGAVGDAS